MKSHIPYTGIAAAVSGRDDVETPARPWQFPVAVLIALVLAAAVSVAQESHAQTPAMPNSREMVAALPQAKTAVLRATAYTAAAVSVRGTAFQLTVTLTNSPAASSSERDKDATRVVDALAKFMADKPVFKDLQTIHVNYAQQLPNRSDLQLADAIDFHKDPVGHFVLHRT